MNIAIILLAGYGSRFKELTCNNHKCLLWVNDKHIIDYQLESLGKNIDKIYCIVGHEKEKLIDYINAKYEQHNIEFVVNDDYKITNNMYSLFLVLDKIFNDCQTTLQNIFLMNGDIIFDQALIPNLMSRVGNYIVCKKDLYIEESMKIIANNSNVITHISKKITQEEAYGCSIDLYKFNEKYTYELYLYIKEYVKDNKKDWSEVAINNTLHIANANPFEYTGKWYEIDNIEDLINANKLYDVHNKLLNANTYDKYDTFVFDLDGVIYKDNKLIDNNIIKYVDELNNRNKNVFFVSNNSSNSPDNYIIKLQHMGFNMVKNKMITSLTITLNYLTKNNYKKIHVFGNDISKHFFVENGFELDDNNPELIVICYDNDLTYDKYKIAIKLILSGIEYIATHCDVKYPIDNYFLPDIGCMLNTIELTTNIKPKIVLGKSSEYMANHLKQYIDFSNACVFGDNLKTDYVLSQNLGVDFVLVMTGVTNFDQIEQIQHYVPFLHYCYYLNNFL